VCTTVDTALDETASVIYQLRHLQPSQEETMYHASALLHRRLSALFFAISLPLVMKNS
jgi:hypothetical protein